MKAIYDAGSLLIPQGAISTSQSFPALPVEARLLPTTAWVVNVTVPPVAAATFTLEAATLEAGPYVPLATLPWPAGQTGSHQSAAGVAGNLSRAVSATHHFVRVSVATAGALSASSWLTTYGGAPGLGVQPNAIVTGAI
jgi:hypothetical protein